MGWAFRHQYELILILEKGKPKYSLTNFSDVQTCSHINHNKENHPHEKPIDLLSKMIVHSSKEGNVILDPFCGSGSTCVACQQNKRKWIGIELDEKYAKMAQERTKKLNIQLNFYRRCKMEEDFEFDEEKALKQGFEEAREKGKLFNLNTWKRKREEQRARLNSSEEEED